MWGIKYHYFSFEEDQIWGNCQGRGGKWCNPSNLLKVLTSTNWIPKINLILPEYYVSIKRSKLLNFLNKISILCHSLMNFILLAHSIVLEPQRPHFEIFMASHVKERRQGWWVKHEILYLLILTLKLP